MTTARTENTLSENTLTTWPAAAGGTVASTVPVGAVYAEGSALDWGASLVEGAVVLDAVVAPNAPWSAVVAKGHVLTIVDVGGNQSADCLLYNARDPEERYSVPDTLAWQGNAYVRTGTVLRSGEGRPLMTVVADELDRQDTIGGACGKESNTLRYGHHVMFQHGCRENFLAEAGRHGLGARDIVSNLNWFMNVPVEADGALGIVDGMSAPGRRVAVRAETDVLVVVSNCPQMNNPCNDFNPTPLRMIVVDPGRPGGPAAPDPDAPGTDSPGADAPRSAQPTRTTEDAA
ncbi:urea amidolyase associated protein UAAP2 [Streptomyces sp. NPDC052727]|uniref:urea amidolyase associated protein UAAP2 n=1 Tax=Streptomyces sp. NPDC052727 TaxID=3154854 RepID=UPI00343D576E